MLYNVVVIVVGLAATVASVYFFYRIIWRAFAGPWKFEAAPDEGPLFLFLLAGFDLPPKLFRKGVYIARAHFGVVAYAP